jgi:hypothetical protein
MTTIYSVSSLCTTHVYRKQVLVDWYVGWLVDTHLLLRDFEPYGIIFTTVFITRDFNIILRQFTSYFECDKNINVKVIATTLIGLQRLT